VEKVDQMYLVYILGKESLPRDNVDCIEENPLLVLVGEIRNTITNVMDAQKQQIQQILDFVEIVLVVSDANHYILKSTFVAQLWKLVSIRGPPNLS